MGGHDRGRCVRGVLLLRVHRDRGGGVAGGDGRRPAEAARQLVGGGLVLLLFVVLLFLVVVFELVVVRGWLQFLVRWRGRLVLQLSPRAPAPSNLWTSSIRIGRGAGGGIPHTYDTGDDDTGDGDVHGAGSDRSRADRAGGLPHRGRCGGRGEEPPPVAFGLLRRRFRRRGLVGRRRGRVLLRGRGVVLRGRRWMWWRRQLTRGSRSATTGRCPAVNFRRAPCRWHFCGAKRSVLVEQLNRQAPQGMETTASWVKTL